MVHMANDVLADRTREHILHLSDAELLQYVFGSPEDYNPAAIDFAKMEAQRRQLPMPVPPAESMPHQGTSRSPDKSTFFHQAARASFWAPIVALAIGLFTASQRDQDRSMAMFIGVLNSLMIVGGLVLAVIALIGMRKVGRRRILGYALAGLIINSLLVVSMVDIWRAAKDLRQKLDAKQAAAQAAVDHKAGEDSFLSFPGWVGTTHVGATEIVIYSMDPNSPVGRLWNSELTSPVGLMLVSVRNGASSPVQIDCGSVELVAAGQEPIRALTNDAFFAMFRNEPQKVRSRFGDPRLVSRNSKMNDGITPIPLHTDFSKIAFARIRIDGQTVEIPGRLLSVLEKQQVLKIGESR